MVPMDFRSQQDHCGLAYNNNNSSSSTNVQYPFTPNPIRASSSSSFPLKPCNSLPPPPPPHDLLTANTTATADHSAPTSPRAGGAGAITKAGEAEDTAIKHRECLRNHAASVGGYVLDGCCEFMPCDTDPLKCAACNCHRSFHRKHYHHHHHHHPNLTGRDRMSVPLLLPPPPPPHHHHHHHHPNYSYQQKQLFGNSSASFPPSPSGVIPGSSNKSSAAAAAMLATTNNSGSGATTESSSEERLILDHGSGTPHAHAHHGHPHQMVVSKKRFRTKFTPEQKEKMLAFADKVGWRFQRQDEAAVEQLCNEIGVSRQVLKVWMHNNKHSLKKQQQQQQQQVLDLEQQLQQRRQQQQQQLIQHPPPPPPQESGTPAAAAAATFGHVGTS